MAKHYRFRENSYSDAGTDRLLSRVRRVRPSRGDATNTLQIIGASPDADRPPR